MITTIGELTDWLLEYANIIEMSMINNMPFIRALLGNGSGVAKLYLYILQTEEHRYSVCDDCDDVGGNRCFPSGRKDVPFIRERDIVHMKFLPIYTEFQKDDISFTDNLDQQSFFEHLHHLLFDYEIIKMNPELLPIQLGNFFTSPKIRRSIDSGFHELQCNHKTIGNFINLVIRDKNQFHLGNLKSKESNELISGFKSIGIVPRIENNRIVQASLERHK